MHVRTPPFCTMQVRTNDVCNTRSSGPSDSLAPPVSPYPQTTDPSPVDSNGTESTEIEDQVQDDGQVTLPSSAVEGDEVLSPDIEIASPQSLNSVRSTAMRSYVMGRYSSVAGAHAAYQYHGRQGGRCATVGHTRTAYI